MDLHNVGPQCGSFKQPLKAPTRLNQRKTHDVVMNWADHGKACEIEMHPNEVYHNAVTGLMNTLVR